MALAFPFNHHPCWSSERSIVWERIHLPVARNCNVQCGFCSNNIGSCDTLGPGGCEKIMDPEKAISTLAIESKKRPNLRIVGISGPGDPLFNNATFTTLQKVRDDFNGFHICLCTNGLLLEDKSPNLAELGVNTISVSMSALNPNIVSSIYSWAMINGHVESGKKMAETVVSLQLRGIKAASDLGILVKVNTILIPSINSNDIGELANAIQEAGASMQNIVPLIPRGRISDEIPPSHEQIMTARKRAGEYLPQFSHCKQCRSDVVGVPGCDSVLS
ncbi:MAG: radical SAM protein [Candidatus Thorarchaeota archaeon]|nr:radical SAM protein [Candidatus Thorarchaeota archaeon]